MKVSIITIGDEILIGQIVDTNSAWMAQQLNLIGAEVIEILTVDDGLPAIIDALQRCTAKSDVVLMTGGLGPTKDDVTKKGIAEFYGVGLTFSQATYDRIVHIFTARNIPITEAHREQCFMPANTELLTNKVGSAPGMWLDENGTVLVSMPGVPYEMKYLMEAEVLPKLTQRFPGAPIAHRTILTSGQGESKIAERIANFEASLPKYIKLAYLPGLGQVRLRLSGRGANTKQLDAELDAKKAELIALIPDVVFGFERETMEEVIGRQLLAKQWTLATAESCTGGYLAHKITSVPGSSGYYQGSVIAYDNAVKMAQLAVPAEVLAEHGAVSEATVRAMVLGVNQRLGTDIGIATSGIAGPGGGSPEKPVGTVWIAVGNADQMVTEKILIGKTRLKNIQYSANYALRMLHWYLRES